MRHADVPIYTAAIDRQPNEHGVSCPAWVTQATGFNKVVAAESAQTDAQHFINPHA